jgi:hypothetical protein
VREISSLPKEPSATHNSHACSTLMPLQKWITGCKRNRLSSSHAALDSIPRRAGSLAGACTANLLGPIPRLPPVLIIGLFYNLPHHLEVANGQTTVDR